MTRRVLFQIHWFLGITAGFVLAVMGVTGALMSFEDEIMAALSPGVVRLAPATGARLEPDALVAAVSRQRQGTPVSQLVIHRDPSLAAEATLVPPKGQRRGEHVFVDPRTGRILGHATASGFFRTVMDLHRWLALPGGPNGIGRQITGFSALALIFFALSGLYLRWPRRALDWRSWFVLDLRRSGRHLYRALHAVVGGWVVLFYLLSALTGLTWSYDWYRQGARYVLTGTPGGAREQRGEGAVSTLPLAPAWAAFRRSDGRGYDRVTINLPRGDAPVVMRVLPEGARFDRMTDELRFDPASGALTKADRYRNRRAGEVVAGNFYALHTGQFFGLPGRIVMLIASLAMPLFTVTGLLLYLGRRRTKRALAAIAASTDPVTGTHGTGLLVVHASQTGHAERLARLSAAAFPGATLCPLADVRADRLRQATRALFVVSTYGEGQAPDRARRFEAQVMAAPADLAGLDYAVLALGDRDYADFCAFGQRVDAWLHASGGRRLFDRVELDGDDRDAERHWQQQLAALAGHAIQPDWTPAAYVPWTLAERTHVNPGSPGAPMYRVVLRPPAPTRWTAGAIAEVMPRHAPARVDRWAAAAGLVADATRREAWRDQVLPEDGSMPALPLAHRDYSVASIDASGVIELLVRQTPAADGDPGIGSGWLTRTAAIGDPIRLRVRDNPGFAPPRDPATPLILIGNGTGLAGLVAQLRARQAQGGGACWLLYGERSRRFDRPFADVLARAQEEGLLVRTDLAFSRDRDDGRYVQHLVAEGAADLSDWVARGAAVYVCGSLVGMATDVDAVLRDVLGDRQVEELAAEGRYRRDIY
ncbi:sulfite reductase flavoprotein subunit alpha [Sphingomonas adhaesiva]|uniref:sulfite reductase flavoprotein subunit alpha n=1 Tax=Sphingomonas adhaesiva TaxID=28212 RepID=UPI002FFBCEE1